MIENEPWSGIVYDMESETGQGKSMKYRRLGKAGIKLSEIGLGGWLTFGHVSNERTGRQLIDKAFECGINFFDTANVYATGACETMWGQLLSQYTR